MKIIELAEDEVLTESMLSRKGALPASVIASAAAIVEEVREKKDAALRAFESKFDHVDIADFRVPQQVIDASLDEVGEEFLASCKKAEAQIRDFHQREVQQSWFTTRPDGTILGQKVTPLDSVGIYVPGGRAQYPSTVLMNGAQAIAALAYGTESIPQVSKVTGPGNAYVAAAKKLVSGDCGIDMVAGPSEVCVLADETSDPRLVAIDLMAQAEHDPMATSYLVTTDPTLPEAVNAYFQEYLAESPRAEITRQSWDDNGTVVVCPTLDAAIDAVNTIAPEHLELQTFEGMELIGRIRNAGAIFVGEWSSEPLGDYVAGPNHTLPTGGTARFSSPLSVEQFVKKSSVICYSYEGLEADCDDVVTLATAEGLWAHAQSALMRRTVMADYLAEDATDQDCE